MPNISLTPAELREILSLVHNSYFHGEWEENQCFSREQTMAIRAGIRKLEKAAGSKSMVRSGKVIWVINS